jgi:predicted HTH domain antitoxin
VKAKGLEEILIPCYGVYDSVDDIDWNKLPNQFVMKDTLGGGGNSVVIVTDKSKTDIENLKSKCREWTSIKAHIKGGGREWPYYSGKNHRIIIEEYIDSNKKEGGLSDYKFFCFDGKAAYLYVIADREVGNGASLGIYDSDFRKIKVQRVDERPLKRFIEKPENYEALKKVAEKLSDSYPEVRIDLYDVNGQIMFGELTFFDGSGYMKFEPDEFDFKLGECFKIPVGGVYNGNRIVIGRLKDTSLSQVDQFYHSLIDYKFFCFNGRTKFIYVMGNRETGASVSVKLFDRDFKPLSVRRIGDATLENVKKPLNFAELRQVAEKLSEEFPHVRVDLYDENNQIRFGELTFYNASGYMRYEPDEFDYELGDAFILPENGRKNQTIISRRGGK